MNKYMQYPAICTHLVVAPVYIKYQPVTKFISYNFRISSLTLNKYRVVHVQPQIDQ